MKKDVVLGLIGAGGIGRVHALAAKAAGIKIGGIFDVRRAAAEKLAQEVSAGAAVDKLGALLRRPDIDAVVVGTPNAFHARQSIAALRAGKDVLCEKPMALNVRECAGMIAAAKRAKKILSIGYVRRFIPAIEMMKRKVDEGALGKVYYGEARWFRRRGVPGYGGWFTTKRLSGGGPLIDLGCHMLDQACWVIGHPKPVRVFATSGCHLSKRDYTYVSMWAKPDPETMAKGTYDVEDYASALIRFDNDFCLLLQVSWAINMPEENRTEFWLAGDKAGATLTNQLTFTGQDSGGLTDTKFALAEANCFERQIAQFAECVRTRRSPRVTAEHGLIVQKILDAVYRSSALKREVVIR